MKKFRKIFLIIGLIIIAATVVIISIDTYNTTLRHYKHDVQDPDLYKHGFWFWEILEIVLTRLIIILSEISIIVNIYGFLNVKISKHRKILYLVCSGLSLLSIIMWLLIANFNFGYKPEVTILLLLWPINIVSLILGFIRTKKRNV